MSGYHNGQVTKQMKGRLLMGTEAPGVDRWVHGSYGLRAFCVRSTISNLGTEGGLLSVVRRRPGDLPVFISHLPPFYSWYHLKMMAFVIFPAHSLQLDYQI